MHEAFTRFEDNVDGTAIVQRQEIPQEFLDSLKAERDMSHERAGEFMLAASIPEVLHLEWLREGYDCTREPVSKTISRLKAKGLDAFIATNKRI
jgi:hypothetical protein